MKGSGDFTIGSGVWPGASKLLEEMGELQQALGKMQQTLGKLIQTSGTAEHWDGDLRPKLVEEGADVAAALRFFAARNFSLAEITEFGKRADAKLALFNQWHEADHTPPPLHPNPGLDCACGGKLHPQTLATENGGAMRVMVCDKCGG